MTKPPRVPGKRLFDLIVSAVLVILTSPVTAAAALLVKSTSEGPVLYRARLVGHHGAMFTMYKFRSMYVSAAAGSPTTAKDDPRITPIGRLLRRYKIDELPQLLNVLKGEMSLVGPRPEVSECVALYSEEERLILEVRPGLTDLASVQFIDLASIVGAQGTDGQSAYTVYMEKVFREKNELRLQYAREANWAMDLKILLSTAVKIVGLRRGRSVT